MKSGASTQCRCLTIKNHLIEDLETLLLNLINVQKVHGLNCCKKDAQTITEASSKKLSTSIRKHIKMESGRVTKTLKFCFPKLPETQYYTPIFKIYW